MADATVPETTVDAGSNEPAEGPTDSATLRVGRRWPFLVGALALVLVGALALFQPWKLIVDVTVDEAAPVALNAGPVTSATPPTPAPTTVIAPSAPSAPPPEIPTTVAAPVTTVPLPPARTPFQSHAHGTDGFASVIDTGAGHVVRIEELDTDNGPDVIVVLSTNEASNPSLGETVHLGELKGNKGNQNYAVPAGTDVTKYQSVVLWCRRFSVAFGSAPLAR